MYNFTWCRTFCNWFVCFLGCGWVQTLNFDQPGGYYQRAYNMYVFAIPIRIAFFASSITDEIILVKISDIEKTGEYYQLAYTMYVFAIPIKIALFASSISDVIRSH